MKAGRTFARLLALPGRIPMAVRVALVVTPAIFAAQLLTISLMRHMRPVVGIYASGPQEFSEGSISGGRPPPFALPMPGTRVEMLRLPRGDVRALNEEEIKRFGFGPGSRMDVLRTRGFRVDPPGPPWEAMVTIFVLTALLVWLGALWITRPLERLARAAESLGRDMDQAPLDDGGPPEVRRAARAFNRMQDRLRRFLRGRSDALLAMSHDLRTPITRLKLRMELLPEEQRAGLAEDLNLLQTRVEHSLDFMRGTRRDEPMRSVVLEALVASVVERLQDGGAQIVRAGSAAPLSCRVTQMERAVGNLLDNALAYAGAAEVEIADASEQACVIVRDRGPGVPEALIGRLAEPFFRVESSRSRESGGTGLGLSIVKDIAEAHGGALLFSNRAGGGFEARLCLPRR